jgi:hypothetical protein
LARYDIGVLTNCRKDIDELCAEAKTKLRGNAQVRAGGGVGSMQAAGGWCWCWALRGTLFFTHVNPFQSSPLVQTATSQACNTGQDHVEKVQIFQMEFCRETLQSVKFVSFSYKMSKLHLLMIVLLCLHALSYGPAPPISPSMCHPCHLFRHPCHQVLKCLVDKFKDTSDACQNEMSRAVRFALWDYGEGAPLTAVCDADIPAVCPKVRREGSRGSLP